jgi:hypothetical protein
LESFPKGHSIRNISGGLLDTSLPLWNGRQKAANSGYWFLVTPALEKFYLAQELIPEGMQRLLHRIGCWWDYRGKVHCERWSRAVGGMWFKRDKPGSRPDLAALEKKHEERLKEGKDSDVHYAPQGGTVKISRPTPAIRHAELARTQAAYNEQHVSMWNMSSSSRKFHGTLNVLAGKIDNGNQWKNSIELKGMMNGGRSDVLDTNTARNGSDHRLPSAGGAEENQRTVAFAGYR